MDQIDTGPLQDNIPNFVAGKVQQFKFPTYVPPNVKDDMVIIAF